MEWLFFMLSTPIMLIVSLWGLKIDEDNWKRYYWFYILSVFMFAYTYKPKGGQDLVVYYYMLENYRSLDFIQAISFSDTGLFIQDILFWIVAKTGCNGLLPAITTSIVYGVGTYITCDYYCLFKKEKNENDSESRKCHYLKDNKKTNDGLLFYFLLLQFLLLPSITIISNIRNVAAFAVVIFALYRELIKKRKTIGTLLLYILPVFLHPGAILLLIFRLILNIIYKHKLIAIVSISLFSWIIEFAYNHIDLFGSIGILRFVIEKAYRYSSDEYGLTDFAVRVSSSRWYQLNFAVNMIIAVFFIILFFIYCRRNEQNIVNTSISDVKDKSIGVSKLIAFGYMLSIMIVACVVFKSPHYWRAAVALKLIFPVIIMETDIEGIRLNSLFGLIIWGLSFVCLVLMITVSTSQSYISNWMIDFFVSRPYQVIFDIINNTII